MQYEYCSCTDPGRVRNNNEDSVSVDMQAQVGVLADGMGGYNAGEVAAEMATTQVRTDLASWLEKLPRPLAPHHLRSAMEICIENANRAIYDAAQKQKQWAGMGTTLVAVVFCSTHVVVGHVGDSRCYRVRGNVMEQLTHDHSLLQEQLDAGLITPQQAALSTQRNLVTRALGVERTVQVEVNEHALHSGDLFLLCSDGLSEMLSATEIQAIVATSAPLQDKAQRLVDASNLQGGRDNITVLLVQAGPAPEGRPALPPPSPLPLRAQTPPKTQKAPKRSLISRWLRSA